MRPNVRHGLGLTMRLGYLSCKDVGVLCTVDSQCASIVEDSLNWPEKMHIVLRTRHALQSCAAKYNRLRFVTRLYLDLKFAVEDSDLQCMVSTLGSRVSHIQLRTSRTRNSATWWQLARLSSLRSIVARCCLALGPIPHVTTVWWPKLHSITLGGPGQDVTDDCIKAVVRAAPNLRTLTLHFCDKVTDVGIAHLIAAKSLVTLSCKCMPHITTAGFAHMGSLTGLTTLRLTGCDGLTPHGLAHLALIRRLVVTDCTSRF